MDNDTFMRCMDRLQDHFGKKLRDTAEYGQALSRIPGDAFEDICRDRIWGNSPVPSKFPTIRELLDDWQLWLKRNPSRQEIVRWEFCPYCEAGSPGLIQVEIPLTEPLYRDADSNWRKTLVRCRHCNNAQHRNPYWGRYTWAEIRGKGWTVATKYHDDPGDTEISVPTPTDERTSVVSHLEKSLPTGDREPEGDDDIPF